jgi:hypothetical protein
VMVSSISELPHGNQLPDGRSQDDKRARATVV